MKDKVNIYMEQISNLKNYFDNKIDEKIKELKNYFDNILKESSEINESVLDKLTQDDLRIDSFFKELYDLKKIYTSEMLLFRDQCIEMMKNILKEVKEKNINNKNEDQSNKVNKKNNVIINKDNINKEKIKTVHVEIKHRQNGEFSLDTRTPEVYDCISKYAGIATSGFFAKEGIVCSELIYKIMKKKHRIRLNFMNSRAIGSFQKTAMVMIKNYYVLNNPNVNGKPVCCVYRESKDIAEILGLESKKVKFNVFHYYNKRNVRIYCMQKRLALIEYANLLVKKGLLE